LKVLKCPSFDEHHTSLAKYQVTRSCIMAYHDNTNCDGRTSPKCGTPHNESGTAVLGFAVSLMLLLFVLTSNFQLKRQVGCHRATSVLSGYPRVKHQVQSESNEGHSLKMLSVGEIRNLSILFRGR
jgi:hypothetical protein